MTAAYPRHSRHSLCLHRYRHGQYRRGCRKLRGWRGGQLPLEQLLGPPFAFRHTATRLAPWLQRPKQHGDLAELNQQAGIITLDLVPAAVYFCPQHETYWRVRLKAERYDTAPHLHTGSRKRRKLVEHDGGFSRLFFPPGPLTSAASVESPPARLAEQSTVLLLREGSRRSAWPAWRIFLCERLTLPYSMCDVEGISRLC